MDEEIRSIEKNNTWCLMELPAEAKKVGVKWTPERLTDFVSGEGLSEEDEANMMAYLVISDPTSYEEAVKERKWRLAMDEEIRSIEKNNTWRGGENYFVGFTDSNYASDMVDSKSTSGYVFLLSGGVVAWSSRKQPIVTLSTTEAEFVAAAACACQAIWMRRVLEDIGQSQEEATILMCDNVSTIKLSKHPVLHGRSKHIRVRFHFLRDLVKEGIVDLPMVPKIS
ncbi:hypothetical protein GH714_017772 [Hevea brasiliensis]|uniref:Rhodanese domain-containing protein n=1 Tax=Hevea brasiliensis TaxID=3981 RepID=A0A6A6K5M7_HEVBR|nr:hypothetical protein GH714_017772 [Hevea brasiliensis]